MRDPAPRAVRADAEALVRRHQAAVWRYLRALGAPREVADDVLQDTFVVALQKLGDDRGEAAVGTFLRRTALHLLLRRRRDVARRERLLLEAADRLWTRDCVDDGGERWLGALRACLVELPPRARQAVELFYVQDLGREAAAQALGMQPNGIKTLLQRVRGALRLCIERRLGGEP